LPFTGGDTLRSEFGLVEAQPVAGKRSLRRRQATMPLLESELSAFVK
jgi:hypothetical protein